MICFVLLCWYVWPYSGKIFRHIINPIYFKFIKHNRKGKNSLKLAHNRGLNRQEDWITKIAKHIDYETQMEIVDTDNI